MTFRDCRAKLVATMEHTRIASRMIAFPRFFGATGSKMSPSAAWNYTRLSLITLIQLYSTLLFNKRFCANVQHKYKNTGFTFSKYRYLLKGLHLLLRKEEENIFGNLQVT